MPDRPKVIPIASKSPTSTAWSAEQCLTELLAAVKSGKERPLNMMVMWFEPANETGGVRLGRWFVNTNPEQEIAMLHLALHRAVEDWQV